MPLRTFCGPPAVEEADRCGDRPPTELPWFDSRSCDRSVTAPNPMLGFLLRPRWSTVHVIVVGVMVGTVVWLIGDRRAESRGVLPHSAEARADRITARKAAVASRELEPSAGPTTVAREARDRRTPAREHEIGNALEELARKDPQRAMKLALAEANFRLRADLRDAVLRGWAAVAPEAAAEYAFSVPLGDRQRAFEAVFTGASHDPDADIRLGARLCAEHPDISADLGQFLITALTGVGAYDAALTFAVQDTTPNHNAWLNSAMYEWAAHEPGRAKAALDRVTDPSEREAAFQGLISGWAAANPASLADYAMHLPMGDERARALAQALPQWANYDAASAAEWLNRADPAPDLDLGFATVATLPDVVSHWPESAVAWAQCITEPALRANTLRMLGRQWAQADPNALRRFIASMSDAATGDRSALLEGLNPSPDM